MTEEQFETWMKGLRLHDEPHGSEYFIVDTSVAPPIWYRLDGSLFSQESRPDVRAAHLVREAAVRRGWTEAALFVRSIKES